MSDRVAELLSKGAAGQLAPKEVEELARLMNAPILGSPDNPPPGFVSKHAFAPSDVAGRARAANWFSRCGQPLALDLTMPVERVSGWPEAIASCADGVWSNVEIAAQNQLTVWLHNYDRESYQSWNDRVVGHKAAVIDPLTERQLVPFQARHGLDAVLVHSVQWDILSALMENSYLGSGHAVYFFLELLWVYETGHFPCGWRGEWPRGSLVVF
jgi:hypothetical protein